MVIISNLLTVVISAQKFMLYNKLVMASVARIFFNLEMLK